MHKHTPRDPTRFIEPLIPNTLPGIRQVLPILEPAALLRDGPHPPPGVRLARLREQDVEDVGRDGRVLGRGLEGVEVVGPRDAGVAVREHHDAAEGIVLQARAVGVLDQGAGGQPGAVGVVQGEGELLAGEGGGFEEARVFVSLLLLFAFGLGFGGGVGG